MICACISIRFWVDLHGVFWVRLLLVEILFVELASIIVGGIGGIIYDSWLIGLVSAV